MALYTDSDTIQALTSETITVPAITPTYISSQIDAILTTQFELLDETYYIQMGESTTTIVLKTPLFPVDLSVVDYNGIINVSSLENIVETNAKKLSPIIYVKEHASSYPPLVDETPLIQGTDYYIKKASIVKINDYWKRFVEVRFVWGYKEIPIDIGMLASLMGYEFTLSSMSATTQISERIGDYQYSSFKDSTTSGYSDNIVSLTNTLRNKYSPPTFALSQELMNVQPILNASGTDIKGL